MNFEDGLKILYYQLLHILMLTGLYRIFFRFGVPGLIRCDEGPRFIISEFKSFVCNQRAQMKCSPLFCPQSNGLPIIFNQTTVKQIQTNFEDKGNWNFTLKFVLQLYRGVPCRALEKSLYEVLINSSMLSNWNELLPTKRVPQRNTSSCCVNMSCQKQNHFKKLVVGRLAPVKDPIRQNGKLKFTFILPQWISWRTRTTVMLIDVRTWNLSLEELANSP